MGPTYPTVALVRARRLPSPSCSTPSGSTFPIGNTTVTCSVSDPDDSNSPATATFTVTVLDDDLALTHVPSDITTRATSPHGTVVTYTPPSAIDEDRPAPTPACSQASPSTFPIGNTTVTCSVSDPDDSNSPATATFTVTVKEAAAALAAAVRVSIDTGRALVDHGRASIRLSCAGATPGIASRNTDADEPHADHHPRPRSPSGDPQDDRDRPRRLRRANRPHHDDRAAAEGRRRAPSRARPPPPTGGHRDCDRSRRTRLAAHQQPQARPPATVNAVLAGDGRATLRMWRLAGGGAGRRRASADALPGIARA